MPTELALPTGMAFLSDFNGFKTGFASHVSRLFPHALGEPAKVWKSYKRVGLFLFLPSRPFPGRYICDEACLKLVGASGTNASTENEFSRHLRG